MMKIITSYFCFFLILACSCFAAHFKVVNDREHYLKAETIDKVTDLLKTSDLKTGFNTSIFVGSTFVNLKNTLGLSESVRTDNEENLTEDLSIQIYPELEANRKSLIFLFALEERRFRARTGGEVRETLGDNDALSLFDSVKRHLKNKDYDEAINTLVKELDDFYELGPFWSLIYKHMVGLAIIFLFILVCVWFAIKECLISRQLTKFKTKIERLKELSKKYESKAFVNEVCVICLEAYGKAENSSLITLECGHRFHGECINEWTGKAHTCPTCRHKIDGLDKAEVFSNIGAFQISMYPYVRDNYSFSFLDEDRSYTLTRNSSSSETGSYAGNSSSSSYGGSGGASGGW